MLIHNATFYQAVAISCGLFALLELIALAALWIEYKRLLYEAMDRLQAGTLQDYTAHRIAESRIEGKPKPQDSPAPEDDFDPVYTPQEMEELHELHSDFERGYVRLMTGNYDVDTTEDSLSG